MSSCARSTPARFGLIQIMAAGVLWGTGGLVLQLVRRITPLDVLTVSAYRMAIAAVALTVVTVVSGNTRHLRISRGTAAVGAATAAYQALYFAAVVRVGVTVSTVVSLGIAPVILLVADAVADRRFPSGGRLIVLATALAGLALVCLQAGGSAEAPHPVLGVLLAVGSGSAYALATAVASRVVRRAPALAVTTGATVVGAIVLLPFGLAAGTTAPLVTGDPRGLAYLVYLGLATMALAYALLYAGLRTTSGSAATVASLMEPVTAAAAARAVLGEPLTLSGLLGMMLILGAIAGLGRA